MTRRTSFLALVLSGIGFLSLLALMQFDPDDFLRLDSFATALTLPFHAWTWAAFFVAITTIGSTTGIILLALLTILLLRKEPRHIRQLIVLLLLESGSVEILKRLVERIRPDSLPWIGQLHSFSFPSGHAAAAMAFFGFIALTFIPRLTKQWERYLLGAVCIFLILAIGMSRIVLAAHYASDVLAGYLLGAFWLLLVSRFVR